MCPPALAIAAAQFAIGTASEVMGYLGQKQAYSTNERAARMGYAENINTLNQRQSEIDASQSEHAVDALIAQARSAGRISASMSALSSDAQTAQGMQQSASGEIQRARAIQDANSDAQRAQTRAESRGASLSRDNQIRSVPKANLAATLLNIGGQALKATGTYAGLGGQLPGTGATSQLRLPAGGPNVPPTTPFN